ncbi:PulJ/GspJ family protein [Kribbella deserti]|uniref:Type II secretion system protein J n=1 Tax=Kribbella deserti TaxID=1926257 RepID=A0ABV6QWM1_9ACTN
MRIRRQTGFTMLELLVTIVIMGIISLPLADLLIGALKQMSETSERMDRTDDARLASVYFARDVASVGLRDYGNAVTGGTLPFKPSVQVGSSAGAVCGPLPTPALRLLSDSWDMSVHPPVRRTDVIVYYVAAGELHRAVCRGPGTTPVSNLVIARKVQPGTTVVSCSTPCELAAVPERITFQFVTGEDHVVTLVGQRRQS